MKGKVIILMGSEKDLDFCQKIAKYLELFGVNYEFRVASAHKSPEQALKIIKDFEEKKIVYITVAGRSNALSAFVDANTKNPVIACPPISEKFGGADIFSSLRVPSGIGSLVTIEPEGAAIAAAKIFALEDEQIRELVRKHQLATRETLAHANDKISRMNT
ncbi:MAG: N5-carboxyaminoimidazole ribonucleotide mutase [miscellaneous Crenarchaeota group-6 archaeon AD8-1]|nr:MAG: N5-carboxyaminoimidazole ribonucleotide mutase [miscellaneous Crenarchaeota group-6 archaeon AD8-1]